MDGSGLTSKAPCQSFADFLKDLALVRRQMQDVPWQNICWIGWWLIKVRWVISHQCVCVCVCFFGGGGTSVHRYIFHWKFVQRCCQTVRWIPSGCKGDLKLSVNLGGMLGWTTWNLVLGIQYFSLWDQEVMGTSGRKHRFHWDRTGTYDKQTRLAWKHPKFNWKWSNVHETTRKQNRILIFSYQLLVYQRLISDKEGVLGFGGLDIRDAPFGTGGRL